jgi:hypothetical protein
MLVTYPVKNFLSVHLARIAIRMVERSKQTARGVLLMSKLKAVSLKNIYSF